MSDDSFIREVEEELRTDKLKAFWSRFGALIIGGAIAIALGTAGFVGWQSYTTNQANASGDRFLEALNLANEGNSQEALDRLAELEADGYGQYAVLARMRAASERHNAGNTDQAVADFDAIAADNSVPVALRDAARVRAAYLLVDAGSYEDVANRAEPLTAGDNAFRHSAREALALSAWKNGRADDALRLIDELLADTVVPSGIAQRAQIIRDMIISSGQVSQG
ncbi:MAG: tetratricopeptide repeat protein [Pseudomonadota bacterium]